MQIVKNTTILFDPKPTIITITGFKTNYLKTNLLKQIKVNTFTISHGSHIFCKDKDNYYNNNEKWWKKYKTFTFFIVVVLKTYLLRRKSYHS